MSRIGKKPIPVPTAVKVSVAGTQVTVSGPKGNLSWSHPDGVSVAVNAGAVQVSRAADTRRHKAMHGLARALLRNMVHGVTEGYQHKMEIFGTGYGCSVSGQNLDLNVGYSHPVRLPIPPGIKVTIDVASARGDETPAALTISGIDKQVVGQFARSVKDARHPEPYKGKGVRYAGEQIRRKAGKAFASGA